MSEKDQSRVFIQSVTALSSLGEGPRESYKNLLRGVFYLKNAPLPYYNHNHNHALYPLYTYPPQVAERLWQLSQSSPWHRCDPLHRLSYEACLGLHLEQLNAEDREHCGVMVGSSRGVAHLLEETITTYYNSLNFSSLESQTQSQGCVGVPAHTSPYTTPSSLASVIAQRYGLSGGQAFVSSACTSALSSLIFAYQCLKGGMVRFCVSGGVEHSATPYVIEILKKAGIGARIGEAIPLQSLGEKRSGMVLGEGASMALLSSRRSPLSIAEVVSVGMAGENYGLVGISSQGKALQKAFLKALQVSGWQLEDIHLVAMHGAGTLQGDGAEMKALSEIFSAVRCKPRVLISKWATGHTLGAAGALQLALSLQACAVQELPTIPYTLDVLVQEFNQSASKGWRNVCLWGLGFGGSACVVFLRYLM